MKDNSKVLVASFQRCGTQSTTKFLERLVGNSLQFSPTNETAYFLNKDLDFFAKHLEDFCDGANIFSNAPYFALYEKLYSMYPDIKVILVTRNEQDWLKSFQRLTKKTGIDSLSMQALSKYSPDIRKRYNSNSLSSDHLLEIFRKHNNSVRNFFNNSDNFLDVDLTDAEIGKKIQMLLGTEEDILFPKIDNAGIY